jgi:hypothetical protein
MFLTDKDKIRNNLIFKGLLNSTAARFAKSEMGGIVFERSNINVILMHRLKQSTSCLF